MTPTRRPARTAPPLGDLSGRRASPYGSAKPLRMSGLLSSCMKVTVRELWVATTACKGRNQRTRPPGEVGGFRARAGSTLTCCI
jgi:hypothetical protein